MLRRQSPVGEAVWEADGDAVGLADGVAVDEADDVAVGVRVLECVCVGEGVGVPVGDAVGETGRFHREAGTTYPVHPHPSSSPQPRQVLVAPLQKKKLTEPMGGRKQGYQQRMHGNEEIAGCHRATRPRPSTTSQCSTHPNRKSTGNKTRCRFPGPFLRVVPHRPPHALS